MSPVWPRGGMRHAADGPAPRSAAIRRVFGERGFRFFHRVYFYLCWSPNPILLVSVAPAPSWRRPGTLAPAMPDVRSPQVAYVVLMGGGFALTVHHVFPMVPCRLLGSWHRCASWRRGAAQPAAFTSRAPPQLLGEHPHIRLLLALRQGVHRRPGLHHGGCARVTRSASPLFPSCSTPAPPPATIARHAHTYPYDHALFRPTQCRTCKHTKCASPLSAPHAPGA